MASQPATQQYPQSQGPPTTSSLFWAQWREGLKDLQNIVLNPWQGHVPTHEEPGTIANPTNIEVFRSRHQDSSYPPVSLRNEVPMQPQASVRSPADLVEGRVSGPAQGQQQQSRQETSPADLVAANQDVSSRGQQQQTQREGQSHGLSL